MCKEVLLHHNSTRKHLCVAIRARQLRSLARPSTAHDVVGCVRQHPDAASNNIEHNTMDANSPPHFTRLQVNPYW
jgi:hypothetical protein